ncbi:MAG TPA: proline--tRNA ligase [Bacillota bacterium]|nr:proline--tRNA ligase [Bacillota bacterium]
MKTNELLGMRYKETPADCYTANHIFFIRGGYIKQVSSGVFSLYLPMRRITHKIEAIIRDEMDKIGGQEVLFPVVMPATLWQESGRYESIGTEMVRFSDRNGTMNVLGMTHEEAAVHLVRDVASSYQNYPFMIYQIQTKFRDEPRCRGGLIRVREFTMKDAYSFHTSWDDLKQYYNLCLEAYNRIFARAGIPEVVAVQSDSGMMGGSISHEFMFLSEIGEDTIVSCTHCDYRANMEAAECIVNNAVVDEAPLTKLATPNIKTIEELCEFAHITATQTAKAVVYQSNSDDAYIVVFIRGDLDVNETKLRNHLGFEIHPALEISASSGLVPGFIGAIGLTDSCSVVFDRSIQNCRMLYCGANEEGFHFSGLSMPRDVPNASFVEVAKAVAGGICPTYQKSSLRIAKGIEVGNIFQLGTKYTKSMELQFLDQNGLRQYPIMGCYGIGVGRLAASVCEAHHDDYGPIWPMSIAPWQVQLCALNIGTGDIKEKADLLYLKMQSSGIEALYDDRNVSAGVMFSDADLLGCPLRIVISPKTRARGVVELSARDKSFRTDVEYDGINFDSIIFAVKTQIEAQMKQLNS